MSTRIYKVHIKHGNHESQHLVRASTKATAIRHAAYKCIEAEVASQDDLVALATAGKKVEDAGAEVE